MCHVFTLFSQVQEQHKVNMITQHRVQSVDPEITVQYVFILSLQSIRLKHLANENSRLVFSPHVLCIVADS